MNFLGKESIFQQGKKAGAKELIEKAQKMVKKDKSLYGYLTLYELQKIYKEMFGEEYK